MTPEGSAALRLAFPPEQIGQKPQPYKKDSPKATCRECGGYHGLPAMHLDFVGHAIVTDRLLSVDPEWTWEPFAVDAMGLPAIDRDGNLWIRLTILGVTRPGVGDGPDAKQRISDALRNAAMRFGVALDLWSKQELAEGKPEPQDIPAPITPTLTELKNKVWETSMLIMPTLDDAGRKEWIADELEHIGAAADIDGLTRLLKEMA